MALKGKLVTWFDDKGFGFIQNLADEKNQVFVHIRAFKGASRRPEVGDILVYDIKMDEKQRPNAINVELAHDYARRKEKNKIYQQNQKGKSGLAVGFSLFFLFILITAYLLHKINLAVILFYVAINIVTFILYWKDKQAAQSNQWRTPESTLHLFSLCGGWIGALIAQHQLRHKSQKQEFRQIFWATVVIHIFVFILVILYFKMLS